MFFWGGLATVRPALDHSQVSPSCYELAARSSLPRCLRPTSDGLQCVLFIAFPPASLIVGAQDAPSSSWCSALRVPVSGPRCPSTVRWKVEQALGSPNGIINSLSKEITPWRVRGGELWREHVLMSFMALQIMHYRQVRRWEAPSHNCIDFSLMATNNDVFFSP